MALKAEIYKVELQIADMDRHYYHTHNLTLARHPSETEERMMLRLFAFARHADEALQFGRGLSTDDEPDLWCKDYSDQILLWVELGWPSEKRLRQNCSHARELVLYNYGGQQAEQWWEQHKNKLGRFNNLQVYRLQEDAGGSLLPLVHRSMRIQCTVQDGLYSFSDGEHSVDIEPQLLFGSPA